LHEKYDPVFMVWLGTWWVLVLCGHVVVHEGLVDNATAFARVLTPTCPPPGVDFANGERWWQLRRFSLSVLRDFGMGRKSIESCIQEEAEALLKELRDTREKPFDPTYLLSCAVSNIICSIVFGNRFDHRDSEFLELLRLMHESFWEVSTPWAQAGEMMGLQWREGGSEFGRPGRAMMNQSFREHPVSGCMWGQGVHELGGGGWERFDDEQKVYNMVEAVMQHVPRPHRRIPMMLGRMRSFIARRVRDNAASLQPRAPRDFIDCFLQHMEKEKSNPSSEFTLENLELTTLNLFFAGTETVSSTLRYGFLMLMKHPHVQEKVHEEIDQVIGRDRAPTLEDRGRMPYTDAVIHEIQRCSDLIPLNVPHRVTRDIVFRGYFIPKDTDVYPLLSSVLHDPSVFKHPNAFDPTNFLDESGHFKRNDAFVPFSSGKRLCLGEGLARMELFLFLCTILQNLRLQPLQPLEQLSLEPLVFGFTKIPPFYQLCMVPR
ncbi:hypothetical protein Q9233_017110, partial [Columba guinea]